MFHAHVSANDIPLYQVFLAGALACRFQRSEAAMRNSLIWNLQGDNVVNGTTLPTTPTSWSIVGIGSFGGNGQSDILFHNASGQNLIWVVQNDQLVGGYSLPQTPTSWSVAGVGDFTGSGTDGTLH